MVNYKFENALFGLNPDQEKAINDLLKRLGQMPASTAQIQQNKQNINQNLQKIQNKKLTTPLDLSRLNQDEFEWLRFDRNAQTKYDWDGTNSNRAISLLTDYFSPLHGVIIENVDKRTDQIDSARYDDGYIIFLDFASNGVRVSNELGNVGAVASGGYPDQYAVNISLSDAKNSGDDVAFDNGDYLMLQYDQPARLWREVGRNRQKRTAFDISGTYKTTQEEAITADSSAGTTEIRIHKDDYQEGYELYVADSGSNASNNNITVVEDQTGNNIATINQNDGYLVLYCDGNGFYKVSELQNFSGSTGIVNYNRSTNTTATYNGVQFLYDFDESVLEHGGSNLGGIDTLNKSLQDGDVIVFQITADNVIVNHEADGGRAGHLKLDGSKNATFHSGDQLTAIYVSSGDHLREIGRSRSEKTVTFDSNSTDTTVYGEDIVYVDSTNGTFSITLNHVHVYDKRRLQVIDIGGNAGSNAVVILDTNNNFNGNSSANVDQNYEVIDLVFNGNISMWIATNQ